MSNIFGMLKEYVNKKVSDKAMLSSINKNNLIELVTINIQNLKSIYGSLDTLDSSFNKIFKMYQKSINENKSTFKSINSKILNMPLTFPKDLLGKARAMEDKSYLSSVKKTVDVLTKANEEILKNIDNIISGESIVIKNVKVLDTYCVSIINNTKMYVMFCYDFLGLIGSVINNLSFNYPKYRQERMINSYPHFIDITNQLCDSSGNVSIMKDVKIIKDNGYNFKIDDTSNAISVINDNILSRNIRNSIKGLFGFPNPFVFVMDTFVDIKHYFYMKQKDEKEWLEYHVSMLRMKLNNMDENSPEYIRLSKAVQFYEDKISKYQRKIDDYLKKEG